MTEIWRDADNLATLQTARKAQGVSADDLEDPLPDGQVDTFTDRFEGYYHFHLCDNEILCDPLLGRLQREIDRKQQSLMKCENARSMRETARTASGKRLKMGTDITINIGTKGVAKGPRLVNTNYVYVALLEKDEDLKAVLNRES